jgi:hypothetical protein
MTVQLRSSIDDLASSVDAMHSTMNESMLAIYSQLDDLTELSLEQAETRSEEASLRDTRIVEAMDMLDNIQRGRRP